MRYTEILILIFYGIANYILYRKGVTAVKPVTTRMNEGCVQKIY